ncbi:MAG: right-handed parallel beta-helix repeat-containing protein [Candidatus Babeliaceae bacterium]|nr:right-handed parallel beta-helix repeat-containing protein [Candidatus Babeliaceae bacterium]
MKFLNYYLYGLLVFLSVENSLAISKKKYCCLVNKLNNLTNLVAQGNMNCNENVFLISQSDIPYTITKPGRYCLVENIAVDSGQTAITIQFDDIVQNLVYLDLNSYVINGSSTGDAATGAANGIVGVGTVSGNVFPAGVQIVNGEIVSMSEHGIYIPLGMGLLTLDGLTIQSCGSAGGSTNGGIVVGNDAQILINPVIKNTNIFGSGGTDYGMILINPQNFLILSSASSFNGKDGYSIRGSTDFIPGVISLCTASGNGGNGFSINASSANTKITDCIAASNQLSGFHIAGENGSFSGCQAGSNGIDGFTIASNNNAFVSCVASGNNGSGFTVNVGTNNDIRQCVALNNVNSI